MPLKRRQIKTEAQGGRIGKVGRRRSRFERKYKGVDAKSARLNGQTIKKRDSRFSRSRAELRKLDPRHLGRVYDFEGDDPENNAQREWDEAEEQTLREMRESHARQDALDALDF